MESELTSSYCVIPIRRRRRRRQFMMCYPINVLINTDRMPEIEIGGNLGKWMKAVEARPAFQRAKARLEEEERKAKDASPGTVS
jgi:hypothetical protein